MAIDATERDGLSVVRSSSIFEPESANGTPSMPEQLPTSTAEQLPYGWLQADHSGPKDLTAWTEQVSSDDEWEPVKDTVGLNMVISWEQLNCDSAASSVIGR